MVPWSSSNLERLETECRRDHDDIRREVETESRPQVLFRHSGWARNRTLVAHAIDRADSSRARRESFRDCGEYAYVLRSIEHPEKVKLAGSSCHDRFCVPCATERAHIIANNALDIIDGKEIRFLTLTIKTDGMRLKESLDKLYDSFATLRKKSFWKAGVHGGVAFVEVKWSQDHQRWHPHLHLLIEGTWLDQQELRSLWWKITGDSFILHIKRPPNTTSVTRYVTKYASKPIDNTFINRKARLLEAVIAMAGRKLCITFGSWRGHLLTITPPDGEDWERIDDLRSIIIKAAHGDEPSLRILHLLSDQPMAPILARAPPLVDRPASVQGEPPDPQLLLSLTLS